MRFLLFILKRVKAFLNINFFAIFFVSYFLNAPFYTHTKNLIVFHQDTHHFHLISLNSSFLGEKISPRGERERVRAIQGFDGRERTKM